MFNQIPKITFTLVLSLVFSFSLMAQTSGTERVKNRAENRTNRRIDQRIDDGVDRTLDKIEGLFRKKNRSNEEETPSTEATGNNEEEMTEAEEEQASGFLGGLSLGGKFEPYENPIRMNISMDVTTVKRNGKVEEMSMAYTFDTWATAMVMSSEDTNVRILLDNKEGYQTMITTDDKGEVQAMRMRQFTVEMSDFMPDENEFTITETGKTRTIDGYNCKEYLIVHEEGTTNSWVTEDMDLDMQTITQALASQSRNKQMPAQNYFNIDGFPVEAITVSKNGKETTTIHYHSIQLGDDVNLDVFDTSGLEIMSLGF